MSSHLQKEKIIQALKTVKSPGMQENIVDRNQIARVEVREKTVLVEVLLTEANAMVEKSLKYQIEKVIEGLDSEAVAAVEFKQGQAAAAVPNTPKIGSLIAVGSGKGGVGKSAMTVNLAVAFQKLGYSVGILDCDIYGPSIPTMLKVADQKPMMLAGKVQPIEAYGMKVMSAGFFIEAGQSVIWRGPMIHKLIQQFVHDVDWGELDVLLIDLPPGTGDAPLSLAQTIPLTGVVMVSTPQKISLIDVRKGASMFNQVKVPILGIIENMSHFVCSHCEHPEEIFDRGQVKALCTELGVPYLGDVPIEPKIRAFSDQGQPFLLEAMELPAGKAIMQVARRVQPFLKTYEEAESEGIKIVV